MKSISLLRACALAGMLALFVTGTADAKTLGVNLVDQRYTDANGNLLGDNWCWAASSKMLLDYYGYAQSLTTIATYGVGNVTYDTWNYLWGSGNESRTGVKVWEQVGTPPVWQRKTKTITISYKGIEPIITNYTAGDVQTQRYSVALTAAEITKEIDEHDAPFVVRIGWSGGGGHFIIAYGTAGGNRSIHDPWFGSYLITDAALRTSTQIDGTATHTWTHTLTTSKIVDVLFLFDSTGSMWDDIASAQASASTLLNKISTKFRNYRVAVANYKDYPQAPYGELSDYTYAANQAFTKDKAQAQAAINSLSASGGYDTPEAVYTALSKAIAGDGIGAWRDNPARRIIIMIGDAPGHDPEPWAGGTSFSAVVAAATTPAKPIAVHCLLVGTNIDAQNQFGLIGGGTGGSVTIASNAGAVAIGIENIIDSVATDPRTPRGDSNGIYPTFTFQPEGSGGMVVDAKSMLLEVQRKTRLGTWKRYRLFSIRSPKATLYRATRPFPIGEYRWRLGFKRKASKLYLPVGRTSVVRAATIFETDWTEFDRLKNLPAAVTLLAPGSYFTAAARRVTFEFGAVPGATSYVLKVGLSGGKMRSFRVRVPKGNPAVITKKIIRFKVGERYHWEVQALNYDKPKPD